MEIQWFPGHMAKTRRLITENLSLVDMVIELADARLPLSSRNPWFDSAFSNKSRLLILNKADMADPSVTDAWIKYYAGQGIKAIPTDSRNTKIFDVINKNVRTSLAGLIEARAKKGIQGKALRIMVVGVPNVGKSTFINKLSGRATAKTGDKPGVTTGKQWINVKGAFELLDMPGLLWEKFSDKEQGVKLAASGAIKDAILDVEELAMWLLEFLRDNYKNDIKARYKLENIDDMDGYEILQYICKKRGFIVSGGEFNTERGANIVLDEFRSTKIGKISLERP